MEFLESVATALAFVMMLVSTGCMLVVVMAIAVSMWRERK